MVKFSILIFASCSFIPTFDTYFNILLNILVCHMQMSNTNFITILFIDICKFKNNIPFYLVKYIRWCYDDSWLKKEARRAIWNSFTQSTPLTEHWPAATSLVVDSVARMDRGVPMPRGSDCSNRKAHRTWPCASTHHLAHIHPRLLTPFLSLSLSSFSLVPTIFCRAKSWAI